MLNWDDVLVQSSTVVMREEGDELVVVLPQQGKYIVLNATGARVLQLSDGSRTLREIVSAVAEAFSVERAVVEADVQRFAEAMLQRGVLLHADQQ